MWPRCGVALAESAQPSALYCSKRCRQAAWRLSRDVGRAEAADQPLRLAYADPPYPGLSARYYRDHPDYRGEVDHGALLAELQGFDGWALSTSADALPLVCALADARRLTYRIGAWFRGAGGAPARGPWSSWEPVLFHGARPLVSASPGADTLIHHHHPRRGTAEIIGAKPWAFCRWLFADLLQARAGDQLADLFPGSGGVGIAWERWASCPPARDCAASSAARRDGAAASREALSDGRARPAATAPRTLDLFSEPVE